MINGSKSVDRETRSLCEIVVFPIFNRAHAGFFTFKKTGSFEYRKESILVKKKREKIVKKKRKKKKEKNETKEV